MDPTADHRTLVTVATAGERLERRLSVGLSNIKGISFAEYRLLRSLADHPNGQASRVQLAELVNLTPSGVTRALRPLEKLGFVETIKDSRDARLALASLTVHGQELVDDATGVMNDISHDIFARAPRAHVERELLVSLLGELVG